MPYPAPCVPLGLKGLKAIMQHVKHMGTMLVTLNRQVIFDTTASSKNYDSVTSASFCIILLVDNNVFLLPSLPPPFLSFFLSPWGSFCLISCHIKC